MPVARPEFSYTQCTFLSRLLILGLLALALASLIAGPAAAQGPQFVIQDGSLRLWPEYDDPGLLVIFSGTFSTTATFPQAVAFPLPQGPRSIQATMQDATGQLLNQPWQITEGKLTFTLPQPGFQIEYYVDRPPTGNQRELNYTFQAPYTTQSLEIVVQQPARASGFSVTPQPESSYQGSDGLTYYRIIRTNIASGEKVPISLRYTKTDQALTAPPQTQSAAAATAPAVQPVGTPTNWLPIALIGLGIIVLLGAAVYWFLQQRAGAAQVAQPRRSAKSGSAPTSPNRAGGSRAVFCTQCGRQLTPEDRFCASCGTPRRS